jgi:hypothetical protein
MRIDGPQITGSFNLNGDTIGDLNTLVTTSSLNTYTSSTDIKIGTIESTTHSLNTFTSSATTRLNLIEGVTGSYATTGSNLFKGTQTLSGSLVPAVDNTYDLGSLTNQFRDLYLSSASLYIDGTKVLSSTTQELQITTDAGQSFKILEAGSDTITLQSNDGNITLATSGGGDVILDPTSGIVALKGTTTLYSGNKVRSSDGNNIVFGDGLTVSGSITVTGFIETQELRTTYISSSILYRSGSTKFGDELTDTHAFTGSLLVSGSFSVPDSGLVSSSVQVDVISTTNIARLATTGSNTFTSNQTITNGGRPYFIANTTNANEEAGIKIQQTTVSDWYIGTAQGTTSPQDLAIRDVKNSRIPFFLSASTGAATFSSSVTAGTLYINSSTGSERININGAVGFQNTSGTQKYHLSYFNDGLNFTETGVADYRIFIKDGGNVGIGTAAPGSLLQVGNTSVSSGGGPLRIYGFDGAADLYTTRQESGYNAALYLHNNPSGVVGNGTGIIFRARSSSTDSRVQGAIYTSWTTSTDASRTAKIVFQTVDNGTNSDKVTILGNGNLGLGTTNPSALLHLSSATPYIYIDDTSTSGTKNRFQMVIGDVGDTQSTNFGFNNTSGTALLDVLTVNELGKVGVGITSPTSKLQIGNNTFTSAHMTAGDSNRLGVMVNGVLSSYVYASTYNDPTYPDYGFIFVHGANTSNYNVWSISPDGPAKGSGLHFLYQANSTNIHTQVPKVSFNGSGNVGIGSPTPVTKLDVAGNIKNTGRVYSGNSVIGNIATNLDGGLTRSYILVCDLNDIAGFSMNGFINAASYTTWNISNFYITKNYSSTTSNAGITGLYKAGGCDMNIVDLNYGGGRYIAIGYTSNPEIDVVWTGYRLTHMLNSDGSAQVIPQSNVSVNSTLATY